MIHLIQNILKIANKLYSSNLTDSMAKSNYQLLINLMSSLKASDVNFSQPEIDKRILNFAPCAYIRLFENQFLNLSIFSIRPDSRLPLHNHPGMNGFIKVISGKIIIKNFELLPFDIEKPPKKILNLIPIHLNSNSIIPAKQLEDKILAAEDKNLALVEPEKGNIHEITVSSECKTGSAFLDLIAPPYKSEIRERSATYYKIIGKTFSDKLLSEITWLVEIPPPIDYWCEHVPYLGPELNERILNENQL